jgi:histidinol-phosphate aminotransferase
MILTMMDTLNTISPFKPHILNSKQYVGGATRGEQKENDYQKKIIKLSSNENLLGPSPKALEAIKGNLYLLNEYGYQTDDAFRHVLAKHFNDLFSTEQFITANSGMELLELIVRGFLDPGLECILSSPTFKAYKNFSEVQGAQVIDIPLKREHFELDVKGILNAVNKNTRIIFISNPNNPTGTLIPKATMDELITGLPDHVIVVYDEVYYHYVETPDYARASDYISAGRNVIGLHSFSKAYGLAGLRLGYAFSTSQITTYLNRLRRPFMINTLAMEAGIAALEDHEHIELTKKINRKGKIELYTALKNLDICFWESEANFIFFKSPVDSVILTARMLECGIMIRPCEGFGAAGYLRVTIGTPEANNAFIAALTKSVYESNPSTNEC